MLENQFSQFGEIHLQFPNVYKVLFHFFVFISCTYMYYFCDRDRGAGGHAPHFLPQIQFLTAFLDHRVTKSYKVTRTATKSQEIACSKFQFSRSQSAQTLLDGSHLWLSIMPPPPLNYASKSLHCGLSIILSLEIIMLQNFMANLRIIFMFTILSQISGILLDFFLISSKFGVRPDSENHCPVHP